MSPTISANKASVNACEINTGVLTCLNASFAEAHFQYFSSFLDTHARLSECFACQYLMYVSHSPSFPPFSIFFKAALRVIFTLKEDADEDFSFSSSSSRFLLGGPGISPRSAAGTDFGERSSERSSLFCCFFISNNSMRFFVRSISSTMFLSLLATSPLISKVGSPPPPPPSLTNNCRRSSSDNCFFISNKSIFFFVRTTSSLRLRSRFATAVSGISTKGAFESNALRTVSPR